MRNKEIGEARGDRTGQEPSEEPLELRDFEPADERPILEILATTFKQDWYGDDVWRWKHIQRQGFEPSEVITVRIGEEIAACFHGAILPIKLEPGLVVDMSFDGDFAVVPSHRGKKIPVRAHDLTDQRLLAAGVALRGGFTSQKLNERFYSKFGYGFVPTSNLHFRKIIGLRPIREKIEDLGQRVLQREKVREALACKPMTINLQINTLPAFHIIMTDQAFTVNQGSLENADLSIKVPYVVIMRLTMGRWKFVWSVMLSLLKFELRARGLVRMSRPLISLVWAFVWQH